MNGINRRQLLVASGAVVGATLIPSVLRAATPDEMRRERFEELVRTTFFLFHPPRWRRLRLVEVRDLNVDPACDQFSLVFRCWRPIPEGTYELWSRRTGWLFLHIQPRARRRYEAVFNLLK